MKMNDTMAFHNNNNHYYNYNYCITTIIIVIIIMTIVGLFIIFTQWNTDDYFFSQSKYSFYMGL